MSPDPQTDHAAIEALARELTDEQWALVFEGDRYRPLTPALSEQRAALLAYLDEVWAGRMTPSQRSIMVAFEACEEKGLTRGLGSASTPLGRAVIKRAKEQGR